MSDNKTVKNVLQQYLQWPILLSCVVLLANIVVVCVSPQAGLVLGFFTILYLVCAGLIFWYSRKKIQGGLVSYAADYGWSQKQLLASMELPYGIADTDGKILWMKSDDCNLQR